MKTKDKRTRWTTLAHCSRSLDEIRGRVGLIGDREGEGGEEDGDVAE